MGHKFVLLHPKCAIPPTLCRNALNNYLNHALFSLSHKLECLLGIFKFESVRNELLDINLPRCDQIHGRRITASRIPNGAPDVQITNTSGSDGEDNILLMSAYFKLININMNSPRFPYRLAHMCPPSWSNISRSGCMPELQ